MGRSDAWMAVTPWSFFLPVLLAAVLGVFIANGASRLVFGGDAAPATASAAPASAESAEPAPTIATVPAKAAVQAAAVNDAASGPTPAPAASAPLRLPGPSAARRDGEARACINGTIARRAENGWEQEIANDAPARCMATSP